MTAKQKRAKRIAFYAGPLVSLCCAVLTWLGFAFAEWPPNALIVAGIASWMAIWWISEVVPIAATSLLPLALFPLFSISPLKLVAPSYMHPFILLLMAGFMAAMAIERWGLHQRLALHVILRVGTSPARLVLGLMIASALCSMWISNTATTLMLLPIAMALIAQAEASADADSQQVKNFATALFLGVAYAASVGGLSTPIGTPPNLVFLGVFHESFPERTPISFASWMSYTLPLVCLALPLIWLFLTRILTRLPDTLHMGSDNLLRDRLLKMGRLSIDEKVVGIIFLMMATLWVTRRIILTDGTVVGWAPALGLQDMVDDATVAVIGVLFLFAWPSKTEPDKRILDWDTAKHVPWDVVLLFGGGIALADGFKVSGLSESLALALSGLAGWPAPLMIGSIALSVTFLTELTSNTATSTILMPVLAAFALGTGLSPELVMIPAVLSASCAFMLPVATAPNAIVYGSGKVSMSTMARAGFWLNLSGALLITLWCWLIF
jgi:sodium-dependent dicarboxylate transporter 2/3/5